MTTHESDLDALRNDEFGQRLEALFHDAQSELLGTLYYIVGNVEDARDTLQDAFLKCWRHRDRGRDVSNLKAWVFRITLNTGRDLRRAAWNRRRESLEDSHMLSQPPESEAAILHDEQLEVLRQAILTLRPEEQEVFLLRQNGGLTYQEIADATALALGTVKTRMRSAIRRLREVADQAGFP